MPFMPRTTRNSQKTAESVVSRPVVVPKAKKAPAKPIARATRMAARKKAVEAAKAEARKKALEEAKAKAVEKATVEARKKAVEKATAEAKEKAIEKAKEKARTGAAHVTATSKKPVENKDKKEANLLYLRTVLASALSERFKGTTWSIPKQDAITSLNNNEFTISRKIGNTEHRCQMAMDQDTASFELTPVSNESIDGLNRSFAAYQESFNKWRVQQNLQGNKDYDLTFTLNVQSKEDLKIILKDLTKECKITKFEMKGVAMSDAEVELIENEIAAENKSATRQKKKVK